MLAEQRSCHIIGAALVAFGLAGPDAADAQEVRVVTFGGSYEDFLKQVVVEDFERETGIRVILDSWTLQMSQIRAMVDSGNVTADLFVGDPWDAAAGCQEGILEPIDPSFLGDPSDLREGAIMSCGIGSHMFTITFAWDKDRTPNPPTSIAGFFDIEAYPGKRSLTSRLYTTFEYALMADGVPNDQIYQVLRQPDGLDRVFKVLEPMKDQIIWWQPAQLSVTTLAEGEVTYSLVPINRYFNAVLNDGRNWDTTWERFAYGYDTWFIPASAPNKDNALKFLEFMMDPVRLGKLATLFVTPPARISALPHMDQAVVERIDFDQNPLPFDVEFWADHLDSFKRRFEAWLQQ
jgi:putative spermidine/putrescine transport system substrate-binding protein